MWNVLAILIGTSCCATCVHVRAAKLSKGSRYLPMTMGRNIATICTIVSGQMFHGKGAANYQRRGRNLLFEGYNA